MDLIQSATCQWKKNLSSVCNPAIVIHSTINLEHQRRGKMMSGAFSANDVGAVGAVDAVGAVGAVGAVRVVGGCQLSAAAVGVDWPPLL